MWKIIKSIIGGIVLIILVSYIFHIPLSLARFEQAVDSVRALIPQKFLSGYMKTPQAGEPSPSPDTSGKGIISTLQDLGQKILAPVPLQIHTGETGTLTQSGVITLTNSERYKAGLASLTENTLLDTDANKKMQDIFAKQYFEHVSPSGVGPADIAKSVGYDYILIGENLALGDFKDDVALVAAWMASPGHRANILQSKYTQIGVAVGKGMYNGEEMWVAVQSFGLPSSACPQVSASLKANIDSEKSTIQSQEKILETKKAQIDAADEHDSTYDAQVREYNSLVGQYNALIRTTQTNVTEYNAQVNASNTCRQKATATVSGE